MARIQIITIIANLSFLVYISWLIVKGKLREEYAIVWLIITLFLAVFSIWRDGLRVISKLFGVYEPPNLIFTAFIFVILIYLLHLSVSNSKLQKNLTSLAQEMALLKQKIENQKGARQPNQVDNIIEND